MSTVGYPLVSSAGWTEALKLPNGLAFYLDSDRIEAVASERLRAWIKIDARQVKPKYDFAYSMVRYEINCAAKTHMVLGGALYTAKGDVVDTMPAGDWELTIPETAMEDVAGVACMVIEVRRRKAQQK